MTRKPRFKAAGRNDIWFAGTALLGLVVWGIASEADAQAVAEPSNPSIAWNVAACSAYVFRGVRQSEEGAAISGAIGRQFLSSDFDHTTWNLGVARQLTDNFALDVRYHDTDAHDFGDIYGSRALVSLKAAF